MAAEPEAAAATAAAEPEAAAAVLEAEAVEQQQSSTRASPRLKCSKQKVGVQAAARQQPKGQRPLTWYLNSETKAPKAAKTEPEAEPEEEPELAEAAAAAAEPEAEAAVEQQPGSIRASRSQSHTKRRMQGPNVPQQQNKRRRGAEAATAAAEPEAAEEETAATEAATTAAEPEAAEEAPAATEAEAEAAVLETEAVELQQSSRGASPRLNRSKPKEEVEAAAREQAKGQPGWKARGESTTGSRLSSSAALLVATPLGPSTEVQEQWRKTVRTLHDALGRRVPVSGDGFCWFYSVLASMNMMENPVRPTRNDCRLLKAIFDAMKQHVKKGNCDHFLGQKERSQFLAMGTPPARELHESNYGSVALHYRVIAHFLRLSLFVLRPLSPDVLPRDNSGNVLGPAKTNPDFSFVRGGLSNRAGAVM